MKIFHDSRSGIYRLPTGAVSCGKSVSLSVRAEGVQKVALRVWWNNSEELHDMKPIGGHLYTVDLTMPDTPGLLWYYFRFEDKEGVVRYYGNAADGLGGTGEISSKEPSSYQITVYDPAFRTPEWMRNGNMMQIMVDRFHASDTPDPLTLPVGSFYHMHWEEDPVLVCNDRTGEYAANDFFGGDLKGVEQKLDYLADMGVTVLYFNPIFKARSNHKYNTGDYMTIDPGFGTEDDFRHLCAAAHERGIRVVLDGVFSHTGSDSLYFNKNCSYGKGGAYNDKKSPYYSWFNFKHWPDDYNSWWGFKTLPTVNKDDPSFRKFIISDRNSVVAHWIRAGSSGWRLDVADELPMDFIAEIRARQKKINPDSALIGEVWEDPSNKVAYGVTRCYCLGDTLDATMNYPLRDAILLFLRSRIDAANFVRRVESMCENLPLPFLYSQMNLLSSHDKPRALSVLADIGDMEPERRFRRAFDMNHDDYARGKRRLIAAWKLICAMPGMPCVYYGDEAGLYGMSDPMCRGTYPWGHEDKELLSEFRDAMHRRAESNALRTGNIKLVACGPDVVMVHREIHDGKDVFGKEAKNESCALAVNRSKEPHWVEYDGHSFEVPAEGAIWLTHNMQEPAKKTRAKKAK